MAKISSPTGFLGLDTKENKRQEGEETTRAITPEEALDINRSMDSRILEKLVLLINSKLRREFTSPDSLVSFDLKKESGMTPEEVDVCITGAIIQKIMDAYMKNWKVELNRGDQKQPCLVLHFSRKK